MLNVSCEKIKIWKNTKEDGTYYFTFSIASRKQDGTYDYMSKRCRFMKGKEPDESCDIKINRAFLSFYTANDKKNDYLMIMDYEQLTWEEEASSNETVLSDDDLPF